MSNAETSEPDLVPSTAPKVKSGSPIQQVSRLKDYLAEAHPNAALPGEHAADTAIRLLQSKTASASNLVEALAPRCKTQYCNFPEGHAGEHGWIG